MDKKKEPSPFSIIWKWSEKYHGGFYGAIIMAVIGVAGTMFSYISVAQMIRILIGGESIEKCLPWPMPLLNISAVFRWSRLSVSGFLPKICRRCQC